ncbi:hypothetical protein OS493_018774 [Desmophyllum pertusum]|uniref:Uncharacterized protein n=1 Tax=Desmophyllum pertusum TaxID=174260 RepID=A0A9W9ZCL3_9CNID|nr:hypothetical protein OS493_018774 [Desmophyllum pertusum]
MASKRETIHGVDSLEKSSPLKKQLGKLHAEERNILGDDNYVDVGWKTVLTTDNIDFLPTEDSEKDDLIFQDDTQGNCKMKMVISDSTEFLEVEAGDLLDNLEWWNIVPHESSDSENDDDEDGICQHANSTPLLISNDLGDVIDETDLLEELRNLSKFQEVAAESENSKSSDDRLFHNSQLSVKESVILLLGFVTRHQLSGVAIEDILSYINLVCPKENNLPKRF